jgi:phytoene synthase
MTERPDDYAACRELLRAGSKSFFAASLALPGRVRLPATVVYAFLRSLDDEVDRDGADPSVVAEQRNRLLAAYAGKPRETPIDRAFSSVVREHALPRAVFDAMLEGFAWDTEGRRYATFDALVDYCIRVAGTVGVCMALLMDRRDREVLARACDLGIAMQLTNIARDVGEDARRGRVYLPLEWLEEAGVDVDSWLSHPVASPAIREVVERLLSAADMYYRRADPGIAALPFDARPAIRGARYIYSAIGDEIERAGFDSVSRRAVVSTARKGRLLLRALRASRSEDREITQTATRGAAFLLDAVGGR